MDKAIGVITSFILLAALAVAVSNRAKTASVLNALFAGLSNLTKASVSPVTGK